MTIKQNFTETTVTCPYLRKEEVGNFIWVTEIFSEYLLVH